MLQKTFNILEINVSVLYNYFDSPIKLFADLYLAKFLYFLTKSSAKFFFQ